MNKGYFITGTDTGVGKTVVTATLAVALRRQGFKVGVMKPIETGCREEEGRLVPQDAVFLRTVSGCSAPMELITPYAFPEPVAPAIAAELVGVSIDMKHIRRCYQELLATHDIVLVEGAGGLLVPVTNTLTMQDIAVELKLPVFIVARNILGTINHTALTVTVARQRCFVLGIVLNNTEQLTPNDSAVEVNEQALRRWGKAPLYCQLPYVPTLTVAALQALGECLVTDRMLEEMGLRARGAMNCGPTHQAKNGWGSVTVP